MRIERLRPDLSGDFFAFFGGPAFSDNKPWGSCWCTFFHRPREGEDLRSGEPETAGASRFLKPLPRETGRAFAGRLIETGAMEGYLAYDDLGKVLGWCNANRKSAYARFAQETMEDPCAAKTKAVVCFVIHPEHRRKGVARALLERIVADAKVEGYSLVEAWPSARAQSAASNFHGPKGLYERLGFRLEKFGRRLVARLDL
jgi:GNAT superfamily N-acetyltransferase